MKRSLVTLLFCISAIFKLSAQTNSNLPIVSLTLNDQNILRKQLQPIINEIGIKKVVGLGEGTHGTKEFNDIRIAIIKELVEKKGFNTICLENAFGDSYYMNQAINANGDIRENMKKHITSIWQTREMEGLFLWIRHYNKTHKNKITFSGIDFNFVAWSARLVHDELKNDKELSPYTTKLLAAAAYQDDAWSKQNDTSAKLDMGAIVKNATTGYVTTIQIDSILSTQTSKVNGDLKNALLNCKHGFDLLYYAGLNKEGSPRDKLMAEMIVSITKQDPSAKVVVLAHNGHVAYIASAYNKDDVNAGGMGNYLRNAFGKSYFVIGTTTANGTYSATTDQVDTHINKFQSYNFTVPKPDSWERFFTEQKQLSFYISSAAPQIAEKKLKLRNLGYRPDDKEAYTEETKLSDYFDGLIFIRDTHASVHFQQ